MNQKLNFFSFYWLHIYATSSCNYFPVYVQHKNGKYANGYNIGGGAAAHQWGINFVGYVLGRGGGRSNQRRKVNERTTDEKKRKTDDEKKRKTDD